MKKCRITVIRIACYKDLMEQYENLILVAFDAEAEQLYNQVIQSVAMG